VAQLLKNIPVLWNHKDFDALSHTHIIMLTALIR